MQLTHSFTVPAGVDTTWAALGDIESVAGCFPGAQVTSADAEAFEGTVKVKLGPIALVYKGRGEFVERDESAHRMAIKALGKDKRGNGTAGADVVATMTAEGESSTRVEVVTDLNVTGKPAQFGRGVMQDVSDALLGQFVECLAGRLGSEPAAAEPESAESTAAGATASSSAPAESGAAESATTSVPGATPAPTSAPVAPAAPAPPAAPATPAAPVPPAAAAPAPAPRGSADAVDLGATVLPVILRSYGPQIAAALGGLVALVLVVRRLTR